MFKRASQPTSPYINSFFKNCFSFYEVTLILKRIIKKWDLKKNNGFQGHLQANQVESSVALESQPQTIKLDLTQTFLNNSSCNFLADTLNSAAH